MAYVAKGKSVNLTVNVKTKSKKKADIKVTYRSADSTVASVNEKGVVKGIKAGKTKVTVTSSKDTKKKAAINIVVKNTAVK
ncbi:MAG: Ig-like domain-containing protein [Lachnospiraceae bacterium]|nr:Ig-like domain-containing protein [Lachnospiraceae bacterium]